MSEVPTSPRPPHAPPMLALLSHQDTLTTTEVAAYLAWQARAPH